MSLYDLFLALAAIGVALFLLHSRFTSSELWQAIVTPLASIIGSGFLIIAPMLAMIGGNTAPWLMILIVCFAYLLGAVIRFNILHAEHHLKQDSGITAINSLERFSNLVLSFAFIISVCFYLRILWSFVLELFSANIPVLAQSLTTITLIIIGFSGWRWGLHALENQEKISVSIKLAIITILLMALFQYDLVHGFINREVQSESHSITERLRMLAGMLLVVQGFETSRYLSTDYSQTMRIKSMKLAQLISAFIYIVFVFLITPLMPFISYENVDETAIINLTSHVVVILPYLLVVAAVMSQFSSAVADIIGTGGLIEEESYGYLSERPSYLLVAGLGIVLVWFADVFEIVALASRAFALYYLLQTILAFRVSFELEKGRYRLLWQMTLLVTSVLLAAVVLFAIPVH